MKTPFIYALTGSLCTLLLAGCFVFGGETIRGNGNILTETRPLSDFARIQLDGSYEAEIVNSEETSILVETDSNILAALETSVENGTLRVRGRDQVNLRPSNGKRIRLVISSPTVNYVEIAGSAKVTAEKISATGTVGFKINGSGDIRADVEAKRLEIAVSGSGKTNISGKSESTDIQISGSGEIDTREHETAHGKVRISGSGKIWIHATETLDASISGSGEIWYLGNPEISTSQSGSGRIRKL